MSRPPLPRPRTRLAVCSTPGCPDLTDGSYCVTHTKVDNQRRHRKAVAHGLKTQRWQKLRAARLELDNYHCKIQAPGCTGQATTVHLDPTLDGQHQTAALADLASACHHCHGVIDAPRSKGGCPGGENEPSAPHASHLAACMSLEDSPSLGEGS